MTSERKKRANRSNSRLSTGPRDTRKTRYNALKHGISSQQAVVPQVDGADAAKRYDELRDGLWHDLAPQGTLESALVDQMAVALQQQRRLLAFENAVIQGQGESSFRRWIERSRVDRAIVELEDMQAALNHLNEPEKLSEVTDPTYLVNFLRERSGVSGELPLGEAIRTRIEGDREISSYSPEQLQELIAFACGPGHISEDALRTQLKEYLGELIQQMDQKIERDQRGLELCLGLASIPDDAELNRILKSQSRIDRGLFKNLHELQRLQAARQGGNPMPPAAVDVTVNVDTMTPDSPGPGHGDRPRETSAAEVGAVIVQGRIAGDEPGGQQGTAEIRQLSEASSDSQSTAENSARTFDHEPEPRQRSGKGRHKLATSELKGLKLKDYLGEARMAQLLAQRDERGVTDDNSEASPPAGHSHEDTICQNEANPSETDLAAD